jgi:hypothetical protein
MARKKEWHINIEGNEYHVVLETSIWSGRNKLFINEIQQELMRVPFQVYKGSDQLIYIGGKECRLVVMGNRADIVMDGVYVNSGKVYVPFKKIPVWTWFFIIASLAIPISNLGGLFPIVLGFLGAVYSTRIGISPYMKTGIKILASIGVVLSAWVVWYLFAVLVLLQSI